MMRRAQPWLGTLVEISVEGAQPEALARAVTAAFGAIAEVHKLMSFHDPASDVSRLNRAQPGELVRVSPATGEVLRLAARMTELSDGAFDIACAPRLVEWRMLPAPEAAVRQFTPRTRLLALEDEVSVRKLASGWIDMGGIAKGYAVDLAVAALRAKGVPNGCVNAGGDLRVFGADGFPVSVRLPRAPGMAAARLALREQALATSGVYFSARVRGGRTVGALVDGRSGEPLVAPRSASVQAPSCAVADALAKVVLATGDLQHPALTACSASSFIV
jgi:thiamine biosynthesis lipoprotein